MPVAMFDPSAATHVEALLSVDVTRKRATTAVQSNAGTLHETEKTFSFLKIRPRL